LESENNIKSDNPIKPKIKLKDWLFTKKRIPYLLLIPAFLYYILFWLTPVLMGVVEVFTDMEGHFSLTANFVLMFKSEQFLSALVYTGIFTLISVVLQFLLALLFSVVLARKFIGSKWFLFIALIPMAIPPTATAILWSSGFIGDGWLNSIFAFFNINSDIIWRSSKDLEGLFLLILVDSWTVMPSILIILVAGMQGLHKELSEAAYLFGANRGQIFKDIVIPELMPSIKTSIILRMIAAIQVWGVSVMILGFGNVPFLVERIAYYVEVVPDMKVSSKLTFTFSFFTTILVLITTVIYFKISKNNTNPKKPKKSKVLKGTSNE
jgi:multiple sugar transport system permease protein